MMIKRFGRGCVDDLQALRQYLTHDTPSEANPIAKRLSAVELLSEQPRVEDDMVEYLIHESL